MKPVTRVAFAGVSIALAVGLGYALAPVPNIELVSLAVVLASFYLGKLIGPIIGLLSFFLYSLLNPYGLAPPPVLVAQMMGGLFIGLSGSWVRDLYDKIKDPSGRLIFAGALGFMVTLVYDVATNLGAYISAGSQETLMVFLIGGLSFSSMHLVSNTIIFAIILPLVTKVGFFDNTISRSTD